MIYFCFILCWLVKLENRLLPWAIASSTVLFCSIVFVIMNEKLADQVRKRNNSDDRHDI